MEKVEEVQLPQSRTCKFKTSETTNESSDDRVWFNIKVHGKNSPHAEFSNSKTTELTTLKTINGDST